MPEQVVPMIHVPNVAPPGNGMPQSASKSATLIASAKGREIDWALLRLGQSDVMLNAGGCPSSVPRRDFDLYTHVYDVGATRSRIDGKVEIIEDLHDTFYGMREFIVRDCNGFWISFGQPKGANSRLRRHCDSIGLSS